jgi:hypothetical protein
MGWRNQLQAQSTSQRAVTPSTFVELTPPLQSSHAPHSDAMTESALCVELSLGAGIELRISRRG